VELLFALALLGWVIFKSYNPNLETAGGEKWMEIAFINATLRSDGFPPQDPWLSGFGISYYYFGYVLMAMVARLSGLRAAVAFNLFIPTLFALTLTGAFSVVYNLVMSRAEQLKVGAQGAGRAVGFGLLGAVFVGILGNLEGLLEVLHSRGLLPASFWRWLDLRGYGTHHLVSAVPLRRTYRLADVPCALPWDQVQRLDLTEGLGRLRGEMGGLRLQRQGQRHRHI